MDTFMDKLAQKLKAQEMIKANTSAELQELGQIKDQIQELKECVAQMQDTASQLQEGNHAYMERVEEMIKDGRGGAPVTIAGDSDVLFILEEEITQVSEELAKMKESVLGYDARLGEIKGDINGSLQDIKGNFSGYGSGISELKIELISLGEEIGQLKDEIANMALQAAAKDSELEEQSLKQDFDQFQEDFLQYTRDFSQHREDLVQLREGIALFQQEIDRVQAAQNSDEDVIGELKRELTGLAEKLTAVNETSAARNAETVDALKRFLIDRLDKLKPDQSMLEEQRTAMAQQTTVIEELKTMQETNCTQLENKLTGVHEGLREGFHKECVKVYRNVQAAFVEENSKQTTMLEEKVEKMHSKSNMAMLFSILAFATGLISVIIQVLNILHIL